MIDQIGAPLGRGEEWWRSLSSAQKAATLRPYFEADGRLGFLQEQKSNQELADMLGIHISSVSLQRRRYWLAMGEAPPVPNAQETGYQRLLALLPAGVPHPPAPENTGLAWWQSISAEEKYALIRHLIETYGLSTSQIAMYLELPSRSHVAGARHRLGEKHGKPKPLVTKKPF